MDIRLIYGLRMNGVICRTNGHNLRMSGLSNRDISAEFSKRARAQWRKHTIPALSPEIQTEMVPTSLHSALDFIDYLF